MRRQLRPKALGGPKTLGGLRALANPEALEQRTVLSGGYLQLNLASDQPAAALLQDVNLAAPWGAAINSNGGDLWLANRGSGVASLYSGGVGGSPFQLDPLAVTIPGDSPTGVVANGSTSFAVHSGAASGPASFLFDSESGDITGWSSSVPPPGPSTSAQIAASTSGAVYKGLALANVGGQNLLYAADFHDNRIDVFDANFNRVSLAGNFTDPNLPAGYAPFNIANIGGRLLVSYAQQDANQQNDVPGVAHGIIDSFDYNGNFQKTLIAGGPQSPASKLNSPWGMALAPAGFGEVSGELLVANSGDGKINAYDSTTGDYVGTVASPSGNPLVINGLHGLAFGNGLSVGDSNSLFVTAVGSGGQHGLLEEIVSAQQNQFPAVGNENPTTAHVNFSGVVAVFNDAQAFPASGFTATIAWGDGFTTNGTVSALPSGGFAVSGNHTFIQAGHQNGTVRITDPASNVFTASAGFDVAPAGLVFSPTGFTATEGLSFSGTVASFIDQDGNTSQFFYLATIDWGDGTVSPGTVSGDGTSLFVKGTHTYATQGPEMVSVTVSDVDGVTGTGHVTATVVSSLTGVSETFAATETSAFSGTVASFTDANPSRTLSDYGATIDWGDGTVSPGVVTANGGGFDVSGSHTYGDEGSPSVAVTISDPGGAITVLSAAHIADADTLTATASSVSAAEGVAFNGTVATFTDTLASALASDFAATIDWGDGTTTAGAVSQAGGIFAISGSHTYLDEGPFIITATVVDPGGTASASAQTMPAIADSDVLSLSAAAIQSVAGATFDGTVATASDAYLAAAAGNFIANIDWGDGQITTGAVSGGNGNFSIGGSHAYANAGDYTAVISLADRSPGTASATASASVHVSEGPPVVTATPVRGAERASLTATVATFSQAGSSAGVGDYTATIVWGDGATSDGTITAAASGFDVAGTHVYADEGQYHFAVTVQRTGGASGSASGAAVIVEPPLADGTNGTPNTRWINEVYGDLLHRDADVGALTYWSGQLAGGVGRSEIVSSIEASGEYRGDEVQQLYQTYLNRPADPSALTFGVDFLASHSVEQLAAIVAGSPEFFNKEAGGSNNGFLDALFHDALDRAVDDGARTYFNQVLDAGASRGQVAAAIFASDEYLTDVVQASYLNLLDRPADSGGQGYFVGQLKNEAADGQVVAALAASDEYFAKTSG